MKKLLPILHLLLAAGAFALLLAALALPAIAGYVQHVPGDVSDSRQNFPLRVARGETVDLSIDFFNDGEPLAIDGATVTLHTRTNGMDAAESWQTYGTATNNSALFVLDVDAVLPLAAGQWSCVASRDGRTLARLGGPAYVRGTAAAQSAALPQNALAGYATTNYVNAAVAALDVDETDPIFETWAETNTYVKAETDPVFSEWATTNEHFRTANGILPLNGNVEIGATNGITMSEIVAERVGDPDYKRLVRITFQLDPDVLDDFAPFEDLEYLYGDATNYTDSAAATRLSRAEAEEGFTEWECEPVLPGGLEITWSTAVSQDGGWVVGPTLAGYDHAATNLNFLFNGTNYSANRTRLRPTPEMEAAWNNKQDAIADLAAIRSGAALGATAVQPSALRYGMFVYDEPTAAENIMFDRTSHRFTATSETTIYSFAVPDATQGRVRDLMLLLIVEDSGSHSYDFVEQDGITPISIIMGSSELSKISQGKNIILLTEQPPGSQWLVSVRHEDFTAAELAALEGGNP